MRYVAKASNSPEVSVARWLVYLFRPSARRGELRDLTELRLDQTYGARPNMNVRLNMIYLNCMALVFLCFAVYLASAPLLMLAGTGSPWVKWALLNLHAVLMSPVGVLPFILAVRAEAARRDERKWRAAGQPRDWTPTGWSQPHWGDWVAAVPIGLAMALYMGIINFDMPPFG